MKNLKKTLALLLALAMALVLAACGTEAPPQTEAPEATEPAAQTEEPAAEPVELVVFAAASMEETLTEIQGMYAEVAPNVTLVFNFDSSGTLKTQIQNAAPCDIFISAGQKQMDQLDIEADPSVNTEGLDFVLAESRLDLLENRVTLCVPDGNPKGIESFDQLAELLAAGDVFMCMGNSDVPVGQYTQKILAYYELDETALANAGEITYGTNVKEVATQIKEGSVDCGVIYCTDAFSEELEIVDYATAEMCGQVIYPAAVLKTSENPEAAQAFLDYLSTPEAMAVFEGVGFAPVA